MIIQPGFTPFATSLETDPVTAQSSAMARLLEANQSVEQAYTIRLASQLQDRLTKAQTELATFEADRAIKNSKIEWTTGQLANKFSLIAKLLQSIS